MIATIKRSLSCFLLLYLRFWAKLQLQKHRPTIVGITGTSGKSSTLQTLYVVTKDLIPTKASFNANSESGLPLNILNISLDNYSLISWLKAMILAPVRTLTYWPNHQLYLAEMAIDSPFSPKNMSYLLTIFKPHVGIFLNAGTVHSENFDTLATATDPVQRRAEIARLTANEKGKMIQALPQSGCAILNTDDDNVIAFRKLTSAKTITYGSKPNADVRFLEYHPSLSGTSFTFSVLGQKKTIYLKNFALPRHYGLTIAAVIACCLHLNLKIQVVLENLEKNLSLPPGRCTLIQGINHSTILDSSYNSSLEPLRDYLELVDSISCRRKLALLGDMRELGLQTKYDHLQAAQLITSNYDEVVLVGPQMKKYVLPVLKEKGVRSCWVKNAYLAADLLKKQLKPNDLLLIKGSQNTLLLEIAVEKLMNNPHEDSGLLCRRGEYWEKRRKELLDS